MARARLDGLNGILQGRRIDLPSGPVSKAATAGFLREVERRLAVTLAA